MKNEYEIRGDVTAIFLDSPKYGRMETLISTADLEMVQKYPNSFRPIWSSGTQSFYCSGATVKNGKHSTVMIHRLITNAPKDKHVDHRNHNTLDNIRENLRLVTHSENQQNRKGAAANSTSGIRGVSWKKANRKWEAKVKLNGRDKYIGLFESLEEAGLAVSEARMRMMPFSNEYLN